MLRVHRSLGALYLAGDEADRNAIPCLTQYGQYSTTNDDQVTSFFLAQRQQHNKKRRSSYDLSLPKKASRQLDPTTATGEGTAGIVGGEDAVERTRTLARERVRMRCAAR
mmetsp:Transcript_46925/g.99710  ORF Transcript_46925/g.99710 Transcript_46925/m.99710 type:complete len:110 (+) Transcript_46925:1076-1405(+)